MAFGQRLFTILNPPVIAANAIPNGPRPAVKRIDALVIPVSTPSNFLKLLANSLPSATVSNSADKPTDALCKAKTLAKASPADFGDFAGSGIICFSLLCFLNSSAFCFLALDSAS